MSRLERLSDAVVCLESFVGSDKEQNPLYRDYHGNLYCSHTSHPYLQLAYCTHITLFALGLFHLHKLPQLNSLVCHLPETLDLAFKLKKKKFLIEVGVPYTLWY